jgi:hypothetical protein
VTVLAATGATILLHSQWTGQGSAVLAQAAPSDPVELEDTLFIVDPHFRLAKESPAAIDVIWIPQPIQEYCVGKTFTVCSNIDFCTRTTTKSVAICRSLPASLRNLPPYPDGTRPPRMFSITFSNRAPQIPGFDTLRKYFDRAPEGSFDRISMDARIRAKVRFTENAKGGSFQLLEVLEAPATE